ncbi:tail fiber assembly protein [Escherichia coli]|nr:tail fiber assembly protein [Escherichia coli]EKR5716229.1 tail fiber assembly protein [Escherichia coli]ELG1522173.1 tail fiber assembly protein [Escherichia coli]MBW8417256.1 tail fiber assembly protein [Escherichia coli]TNK09610.1 tail fiber assembly protein [Escherichia coli]
MEQFKASGVWPDDAVLMSVEVFNEFFIQLPPNGKMRSGGPDGLPVWIETPPPTKEELIHIAEAERQMLITKADAVMLDWRTELMLGEISDANRAKLSAWLAYKNEVKMVDVTTDPEHVNWPVPPEA